jgi:hypothetical protein
MTSSGIPTWTSPKPVIFRAPSLVIRRKRRLRPRLRLRKIGPR